MSLIADILITVGGIGMLTAVCIVWWVIANRQT